jgi:hypothetical protein
MHGLGVDPHFFWKARFNKDQINPKRQTAGPPEGGSPELDLVDPH